MRLYNPVYHFKRAIHDIRTLRQSFETFGQPQRFTSQEHLARVLHQRLFLAATIAIPATITGITVGALVQTQTGSFEAGLLINLLIANVIGLVGLEILWGWLSRDLYHCRHLTGFRKLQAMITDLAMVHLHSLIGVLLINALSMGLTGYLLENIHRWQPTWNLNRYVPATLISPIFGWCLLDAPFIRHMNDLYETHAHKLAERYRDLIVRDSTGEDECETTPSTETSPRPISPVRKVTPELPKQRSKPKTVRRLL
ncbi:MAG: hypothetical protein SFU56_06750 [Capsulimonadales bacterium]|nr:hypothetical protein [Capsulimonadales bacterium]